MISAGAKRKTGGTTAAAAVNADAVSDPHAGKHYLYLIGHNQRGLTPYTHINCTDEPLRDIERHNSVAPGRGMRDTKKAAGHWHLLLSIYVPPSRHLDMQRLMDHWRSQHRTVPHRLAFGLQMAAQLMLLCFVNELVLTTPEWQSKIPSTVRARMVDKLNTSQVSDEQQQQQPLPTPTAENADAVISLPPIDDGTRRSLARYLETPDVVYLRRHPGAQGSDMAASLVRDEDEDDDNGDKDETKVFSDTFLDRLNTLRPVAVAAAAAAATAAANATTQDNSASGRRVSKRAAAAALAATFADDSEAICFTKRVVLPSASSAHATKAIARRPGTLERALATRSRSSRRSSRRVGRATHDVALGIATAAAMLANAAAAGGEGGVASIAAVGDATDEEERLRRQRKSISLVSKLAALHQGTLLRGDASGKSGVGGEDDDGRQLLRRYGDVLCDNIADSAMRAKTKATNGSTSQRCLCGAHRSEQQRAETPPAGDICPVCQRIAASYERISLDLEQLGGGGTVDTHSTPPDENADAMDQFLETLLVSFNDAPPPPPPATQPSPPPKTKRRRTAETAPTSPCERMLVSHDLQPKLLRMRQSLASNLMPHSGTHRALVETMFGV